MTPNPKTSPSAGITVSIITPCYNGARFLHDTITSALTQTRPPVEVIVIDDGSTDESAAIAEAFGPPVRVLRQANQGESVARNRGIAEARGTHLLFLDADDLVAPESLARMAEALSDDPEAVALMGCRHFQSDTSAELAVVPATRTRFYPDIVSTNFGPPNCWLVPAAIVRKAGGFYEPLQWFEDWDLWWRVGLYASRVIPVDYVGAQYRQHARSQFATITMANRTRGHAIITARMATTLLDHTERLAECAEPLLWATWTALVRATEHGVSWDELSPLSEALRRLATNGPRSVIDSKLARSVRLIGVRGTLALQQLKELAH